MLEFIIYLIFGIVFVVGSFAAAFFFAPHRPTPTKLATYECGEETIKESWIQFDASFYLFGIAFVIFDVEVIFLIPCALVMRSMGLLAFVELLAFIAVLLLGLAYAWRKGALEWI